MAESALFDLACAGCGAPYPARGWPERCPHCGGCWRQGESLAWRAPLTGETPAAAGAMGLRRWAAALGLDPVELPERPLARPPGRWRGAWICQQGSAPAGSYKERGAEVMVAAAARRGIAELFLDSSGNAGFAVARAAAARGLRCTVLVPASTPAVKVERIRAAGGRAELISGDRDATHLAALEWRRLLPYAAPFFQPAFQAGVATLAWELWEELGGRLPEHWLLPVGNGQLLMGLGMGLELLRRAGAIARLPALHAVQLAGYASLHPAGLGTPQPGPPTAAGVAIAQPPRRADMLAWLDRTGGDVTVVSEEQIAAARAELANAGWRADPTGAAAFAGYCARPDLRAAGRPAGLPADPGCLVVISSLEGE